MRRLFLLMTVLVSVILFTGCPAKAPDFVDLGTIPEQYLPTVPYEDGQTFYLQHESDRVVIPFHVSRRRFKAQGDNLYGFDYYGEKNQPAPSVYFEYEVDITNCVPDYPIFDIDIRFSNSYLADSLYFQQHIGRKYAQLTSQRFYAAIPFFGDSTEFETMLDSLNINGHAYYDVFQYENTWMDLEGIYIKCLYYNYAQGVLRIDMSNGEKYLLYEEE